MKVNINIMNHFIICSLMSLGLGSIEAVPSHTRPITSDFAIPQVIAESGSVARQAILKSILSTVQTQVVSNPEILHSSRTLQAVVQAHENFQSMSSSISATTSVFES